MSEILLLRLAGRRLDRAELQALRQQIAMDAGAGAARASAYTAVEHAETYVYLHPDARFAPRSLAALRAVAGRLYPQAEARVLRLTTDRPGASADQPAPWHYIVETDVLAEAEQDFNAWYEEEHLPGLASVPGTVRARRYVCDAAPRYHACYDLHTRETFGSPPWLAVRASSWSDRVRPSFRNTKRTMFQAVA
ncbi:hypothetical protein CAL29_10665 [Bordetella genomosp. 10]|uniref:EthD domain-containing protein n=1 Tax=Bordetella genomosp. 10 TaxID=1416804 RepID=A0A261S9G0_9BORD|nr:DUF4286 family protein [Bordetella genomosp. 10]OZI34014.1 hypothetical protein CAL29_10665 [Bordetella genomosp. 10]